MLRQEVFALTYCMKGMTYGDVEGMLSVDRVWYLNRLNEQLKQEADGIKKGSGGKNAPKFTKSKGRRK